MTKSSITAIDKYDTEQIIKKVDLYMNLFILPNFNPNDIFWWFSISGGKDSYTMTKAISDWYKLNEFKLYGKAFFINQWGRNYGNKLKEQFNWIEVEEINAISKTKRALNYKYGQQAPCRGCADVRRIINDEYISKNFVSNKINFLSRGLHLSDTSISLLWRSVFSNTPFEDYNSAKKGAPIIKLQSNYFLVKPLMFTREFESQYFSEINNYQAFCCGCPACKYPSRRDIVEETLLKLFDHNPLWEFNIPGLLDYLIFWANSKYSFVKQISLKGIIKKDDRIPYKFYEYVFEIFNKSKNNNKSILSGLKFNDSIILDKIGRNKIIKNYCGHYQLGSIPKPRFINDATTINSIDKKLISTLGPFWGAIGLPNLLRNEIFAIQKDVFDLEVDPLWSQTNKLLQSFYKEEFKNDDKSAKRNCIYCFSVNSSSFSSHTN